MPICLIKLITWNVQDSEPPDNLSNLFRLDLKTLPELYAICIQEKKSYLASIFQDAIFDNQWTKATDLALSSKNFVKIAAKRQGGSHLSIYLNRKNLPEIKSIETRIGESSVNLGKDAYFSIKLLSTNNAPLEFVSINLSENSNLLDYNCLLNSLKIDDSDPKEETWSFFFGDFRSCILDPELTDEAVRTSIENYNKLLEVDKEIEDDEGVRTSIENFNKLLNVDKLNMALTNQEFMEFKEGKIMFPPSYDAGPGTRPAWRDRVLWRVNTGVKKLDQKWYGSFPIYDKNEHKPVVAAFYIHPITFEKRFKMGFDQIGNWFRGDGGKFKFWAYENFPISPGDWVAMFPVGFHTLKDYASYVWASELKVSKGRYFTQNFEGAFKEKYLKNLKRGMYILLFMTENNIIIAESNEFELLEEKGVEKLWCCYFKDQLNRSEPDGDDYIYFYTPLPIDGIYIEDVQNQELVKDYGNVDSPLVALKKYFSDVDVDLALDSFTTKNGDTSLVHACVSYCPAKYAKALDRFCRMNEIKDGLNGFHIDSSTCTLRAVIVAFKSLCKDVDQKDMYLVRFDHSERYMIFSIPKALPAIYKYQEVAKIDLQLLKYFGGLKSNDDAANHFLFPPQGLLRDFITYDREGTPWRLIKTCSWIKFFCPSGLSQHSPILMAFYGEDSYFGGKFPNPFISQYGLLVDLATSLKCVLVAINHGFILPGLQNIQLLAGIAFTDKFRKYLPNVSEMSHVYFIGFGKGSALATEAYLAASTAHKCNLIIIDPECRFMPLSPQPVGGAKILSVLMEREESHPNAHMSYPLSLNFFSNLSRIEGIGETDCFVYTSRDSPDETPDEARLRFYGNAEGLVAYYIRKLFHE